MRRPTSQFVLQKAPLLRLSKVNLGKMCSIFFNVQLNRSENIKILIDKNKRGKYLITWNFRDTLISRNYSAAKNKCRELNMTRKLSDSHYVNNHEIMGLLPLKRLLNHIFNYSEALSWSSSSLLLSVSTPGSTAFVQSSNCPFTGMAPCNAVPLADQTLQWFQRSLYMFPFFLSIAYRSCWLFLSWTQKRSERSAEIQTGKWS